MFVDPRMKPLRLRRGMLAALMDETDLVRPKRIEKLLKFGVATSYRYPLYLQPTEEMFEKSFNFRKEKLLRWALK